MLTETAPNIDAELAEEIGKYYDDPLGFVLFAYPWGEEGGPLAGHPGPDEWQVAILKDIGRQVRDRRFDGTHPVLPIRFSVASGHGIGKSVLAAFLVNWIMSTRPNARGTVTANTFQQLQTRTWASIQTWTKRLINSHWFTVTSDRLYYTAVKDSWFCSAQSSKEENSEAFAGQHAADSTSFYIFDEASAIPDKIFEVAEGGLTDGEPMFFLFGNATRSQGSFHRVTFGAERKRWNARSIDSRECRFSNKALIEQWREDYGEDSDFFRVRVCGLPPRADDSQYIDLDRIIGAQKREVVTLPDEPLVCGVDLAWGGSDDNVVRFRCGSDARSIPKIRIPGEKTRDASVMIVKLSEILSANHNGRKVHTMFLDSAGIAGAIAPRLRQLGHANIVEINFGADSPDDHFGNMRAFMWGRMKEWLLTGSIDPDSGLEQDLAGPGYFLDRRVRLMIESKDDMRKRGLDSPDDADALALTFAMQVAPPQQPKHSETVTPLLHRREQGQGWMG